MNKSTINELLNSHEIKLIEKHLIYSFLQNNDLEPSKSPIISELFADFKTEPEIYFLVSTLNIKELKLLENYLELLIPTNDRKVNGAFFTPTYVVDFIIKEVSPKNKDKCLDPSCGCGAFLIGLVEYYKKTFNKSVKKTIKENIYGSDILNYNVKRSKIILSIFGLLNNEIIEESDFNIYNQDSLKADWKNEFEIIVGNPPYVKFQDLSDDNRLYLIDNWKSIENGTFNLYFAFFELGYKLLTTNGKLGYITPNNYFTSLSALSLRKYFLQNKCVTRIVDFRHKKVFDAQTYTAITFANKKANDSILFDKIKDEQSCSDFLISANGSPNYLENLDVSKWRLLKTNEQENIKIIERIGTPIKQLFNIAVGIATLKDEVFFVDCANEKNGFLTKTTENGTFLIEKEITRPVYKISKFKSQKDIENNTLRIITPYHTSSKNAVPILEDEFIAKYPKCYEFLLSEKEKLEGRGKGKKVFSPFYVWGRTQGITRFGKKILNPTFSKHPRFLFVPEKDAYYTNGYGIYFDRDHSNNAILFEDKTHEMSKEENILVVQKILNSIVMDYYVSNTSVSIQGGFPCYQKNFIEKFTIPNFTKEEIYILKNLTDKVEIDEFLIEKYQVNIPVPNRLSCISSNVLVNPS
ncbi:Eco57I restriction-modification methylase domain-containing protein [Tenacibaculum aquimarinum]|uniref:Eco57I restriction-modification methylase domain-containing protein n=1 Tax=Tenacibaculum aquimarinum TaxID=2910675 RepID=UPI001F0B0D29|nr:N-6 DNA methylase [Tenacibaculum aquimarinum]MCH3883382.1 SAM-dependent methyltransferase [Tenacibaculum aquimarinum]